MTNAVIVFVLMISTRTISRNRIISLEGSQETPCSTMWLAEGVAIEDSTLDRRDGRLYSIDRQL